MIDLERTIDTARRDARMAFVARLVTARRIRTIGLTDHATCRDWIQGITGRDPGLNW